MIDSVDQNVLLLAGPIGVGKSSVVELLVASHGFQRISTGTHLAKILESRGREVTRKAQVELGDQLDLDTDFEWVVRDVARTALTANPSHSLWIFDSVRKRKQVEHFRRWAPNHTLVAYLSASEETLRARFDRRNRVSDQQADYETAIDSDNEREARSLSVLADVVLQTDYSSPEEIAIRLWEEFVAWSKLSS